MSRRRLEPCFHRPKAPLVGYELHGRRPRSDYDQLARVIKGISGVWCHLPESKWLIETELSTQTVAERLAPLTCVGDQIFVTRIYSDWYSYSLSEEQLNWLRARNFGSVADAVRSLFPALRTPLGSLVPKSPPANAIVDAVFGARWR
jgi:hypothetical protein